MKTIKRIPVTKEGFQKLHDDFAALKKERPAAVRTLADARGMGDLSENGLYTAAKARLRSIDNQMFRLDIQIKLADVIEGGKGAIGIGNSVVVGSINGEKKFHIVGDYEANPSEGKISQHSPLGRALVGKKEGEVAEFETPAGITIYTILKILV